MRDAYIAELYKLAAEDPRVLLLSGDIGFKVFDPFIEAYGKRYLNMGIAEQGMMGAAAGLALSGKIPHVYTIIPFLTMRAFEQIRVDVAMMDQPVRIVGVGGGLAYDILGPTHHSIEDIAILRSLPNMTVIVPSDPTETKLATRTSHELKGGVYIRLGKNGEPELSETEDREFEIGKAITLKEGSDVAIIGCGPILSLALDVAAELESKGISCRVVNMHTIKPIDKEAIAAACECKAILTLEEHSIIGGLGGAVSEVLAEIGNAPKLKRLGVQDKFTYVVGSQDYLFEHHGLTAQSILSSVDDML
jgi:transketolase